MRWHQREPGELGRLVRHVVDYEGEALGTAGIDRGVEAQIENLVCWT